MYEGILEELVTLRALYERLERRINKLSSQVCTIRRWLFGPEKHGSRVVSFRLEEDTAEELDKLVKKGVFRDRGTAVLFAVYELLRKEAAAMDMSLSEFLELARRRV